MSATQHSSKCAPAPADARAAADGSDSQSAVPVEVQVEMLGLQYKMQKDQIQSSQTILGQKRKMLSSAGDALKKSMRHFNKRRIVTGDRVLVLKEKPKKPGLSEAFLTEACVAYCRQEFSAHEAPEVRGPQIAKWILGCRDASADTTEYLDFEDLDGAAEIEDALDTKANGGASRRVRAAGKAGKARKRSTSKARAGGVEINSTVEALLSS